MWLHENTAYTFHGDAPIAGLTVKEDLLLQLGHAVRQEQQEDAQADVRTRSSRHSKSRASTRERARELAQKRQGRRPP